MFNRALLLLVVFCLHKSHCGPTSQGDTDKKAANGAAEEDSNTLSKLYSQSSWLTNLLFHHSSDEDEKGVQPISAKPNVTTATNASADTSSNPNQNATDVSVVAAAPNKVSQSAVATAPNKDAADLNVKVLPNKPIPLQDGMLRKEEMEVARQPRDTAFLPPPRGSNIGGFQQWQSNSPNFPPFNNFPPLQPNIFPQHDDRQPWIYSRQLGFDWHQPLPPFPFPPPGLFRPPPQLPQQQKADPIAIPNRAGEDQSIEQSQLNVN